MTPCPKVKPLRDPAYLAWLRKLPCVVCGRGPCEAAHQRLLGGGAGSKPDDRYTLPYCYDCHHVVEHGINGGILTLWNTRGHAVLDFTKDTLRRHLQELCVGYRAKYDERGVA
jgi:hypothetical protein